MMNSVFGFFGGLAFITTIIGMVPQLYKSIKSKSMRDISMLMLLNGVLCAVSWIVYGIGEGAFAVVWSNVFSLLVAIALVAQKLRHG